MKEDKIYDFVGIGIGPFNLSLACLTAPIEELDGLFLDKAEKFDWHPGMMLQDTTLQIPFLADLVTMADPTSPYSFLNYIKQKGKIYSFYIREDFFLLRNEYNQYCQWAISQLNNLRFNTDVQQIHFDAERELYIIQCTSTLTGEKITYSARKLVIGIGNAPYIPESCRHIRNHVVHSSAYLPNKSSIQDKKKITVIGSGQSAAEIFYDLLQETDTLGYELHWITQSARFHLMEYSKLTLEMTSPEYVDYFYQLPKHKKDALNKAQKHLYKGINQDLINDIFNLIYTKNVTNDIKVSLRTNSIMKAADINPVSGETELEIYHHELEKSYTHSTDALVLATGYEYSTPAFLDGIADIIRWDEKGRYDVHRNYSIDRNGKDIFVQNAEYHTHGFVTPDLGMVCYRNSYIIRELTGKEIYPVEKSIAFQQFGIPENVLSEQFELNSLEKQL